MVTVKITDISGKVVKEHQFTNSRRLALDISGAPGLYFAAVQLGRHSKVFKLVKQ